MALAFLCSRLKRLEMSPVNFRAFVVDHGVRSGSDVEAHAVAKLLEEQGIHSSITHLTRYLATTELTKPGIPTDVSKIEWPEDPAPKLNFESLARRYRYRTLGQACRGRSISSLFLAHHEDDQAETIWMRLQDGQRSKGLVGIRESSDIPECYGLYGVHESGGIDDRELETEFTNRPAQRALYPNVYGPGKFPPRPQLLVQRGGIKVYRPLLNFSKDRLVATCQENGIEWFEDHTNKDPTLTKRNAIRHLFAAHALPAALTKPSLLSLSRKMTENEARRRETVDALLARCEIARLDLNTGTLDIRFPDLSHFRNATTYPLAYSGQTAAELLKRVVMIVAPTEHVDLSSLHNAVACIFPELSRDPGDLPATSPSHPDHPASDPPVVPRVFTASEVYFHAVPRSHGASHGPSHKQQWTLSRAPHKQRCNRHAHKHIIAFPSTGDGSWSPWTLWDGRYWIRIRNPTARTLWVRPLDLPGWGQQLAAAAVGGDEQQEITRWRRVRMKRLVKGVTANAKKTLPAIVAWVDGAETVVALPTLEVNQNPRLFWAGRGFEWEVRYKKIDIAGLHVPVEKVQRHTSRKAARRRH